MADTKENDSALTIFSSSLDEGLNQKLKAQTLKSASPIKAEDSISEKLVDELSKEIVGEDDANAQIPEQGDSEKQWGPCSRNMNREANISCSQIDLSELEAVCEPVAGSAKGCKEASYQFDMRNSSFIIPENVEILATAETIQPKLKPRAWHEAKNAAYEYSTISFDMRDSSLSIPSDKEAVNEKYEEQSFQASKYTSASEPSLPVSFLQFSSNKHKERKVSSNMELSRASVSSLSSIHESTSNALSDPSVRRSVWDEIYEFSLKSAQP